MTTAVRFPYLSPDPQSTSTILLPLLPIQLGFHDQTVETVGLLDSGATVNVLPFTTGLQLGLVWEEPHPEMQLTGNLANLPAKGVIISAQAVSFPAVDLAFAWSQSDEIPLLLGQINFFMTFDICFFRSRNVFELLPKQN
ncbi:hypothetical protein MNBD_CHLOROFLEXI01-3253 [hydrothermal vent metagenome]|uniref:Peptidase A2 domain-containing protein n=1 Tax=hydrothermal vent metagenome TaxID=652676 RepID=A0A3B0VKD9_9ZZZZ